MREQNRLALCFNMACRHHHRTPLRIICMLHFSAFQLHARLTSKYIDAKSGMSTDSCHALLELASPCYVMQGPGG